MLLWRMDREGKSHISSSITDDTGNYTCVVINRVDNSSDTASVTIQGLF